MFIAKRGIADRYDEVSADIPRIISPDAYNSLINADFFNGAEGA